MFFFVVNAQSYSDAGLVAKKNKKKNHPFHAFPYHPLLVLESP